MCGGHTRTGCDTARVESLDAEFFSRPAVDVAPALLGMVVSHGPVAIRISEAEAYQGAQDPGSHAFRRKTDRNAALFGPPGTAYVYMNYGMHLALNLVCLEDGVANGCLIRAGEVIKGEDVVRRRRTAKSGTVPPKRNWARGPGNLAQALGITLTMTGDSVVGDGAALRVYRPSDWTPPSVSCGPRVGVSGPGGDGKSFPWRYWINEDPTVSAYRPATIKKRTATTAAASRRPDPLGEKLG